jgi:hypothetical protein
MKSKSSMKKNILLKRMKKRNQELILETNNFTNLQV